MQHLCYAVVEMRKPRLFTRFEDSEDFHVAKMKTLLKQHSTVSEANSDQYTLLKGKARFNHDFFAFAARQARQHKRFLVNFSCN